VLAQGTNDTSEAVPLLAELLSIPTADRYPPLNLSPQKRKEKTLHAQLTQVEGLAAQQPVLMVWEDVQWGDPTTQESLDLLIDRMATLRVLVIIAFRPEFTPPWTARPHVTMLTLSRLAPRQRAQMIHHLTGGKPLPKEVADQIVDRTDGVPLFVEELTKSVVESGLVAEAEDRYVATGPPAPLMIPTTLHASLLARLDRLAPTREIAQTGAALGRSFSHELISAVAQMPQRQVDVALAQLASAGLIFQRGTPPDAEYTFKHALVQDAAYSTLLRSRRQQIHVRIAKVLETRFPEIMTTQPQLLAQHCFDAGLDEKAVGYWFKAGQRGIARSAMVEAVGQLQRGLVVLTRLPENPWRQQQELDLRIALGRALMATKGFGAPDVAATYFRARVLAEQLDRHDYLARLVYGQHLFHLVRSEHKLSLSHAEQIEQIGERRNDLATLLLGHYSHGVASFYLGQFNTARTLFEQCGGMNDPAYRVLYAEVQTHDLFPVMLVYHAQTLAYLGHLDQARAQANRALSEARRTAHAHTLAIVLILACRVEWIAGSPQCVQAYAHEGMALSNEHGFPFWKCFGNSFYGWSRCALGYEQEGIEFLAKGLSELRAMGAVINVPWMLMMHAETCIRLGQLHEGLDFLRNAAKVIDSTEEQLNEVELYHIRGNLLYVSLRMLPPSGAIIMRWQWRSGRVQNRSNCAPPLASPASGATRVSAPKPVIYSRRSTAGSPKV
jgi:hypothetical protein